MLKQMLTLILGFALFASAAVPTATVTAGGSFKLGGVMVPASATESIPAGIGDEISAMDVPVVIRFGNQGIITLDPGSSLKVEERGGKIVVRLLSDSLQYQLAARSNLVIFNQRDAVAPALQGIVSVARNSKTVPIVAASDKEGGDHFDPPPLKHRSDKCPPSHRHHRHHRDCD